jgi:hypothetical protein
LTVDFDFDVDLDGDDDVDVDARVDDDVMKAARVVVPERYEHGIRLLESVVAMLTKML